MRHQVVYGATNGMRHIESHEADELAALASAAQGWFRWDTATGTTVFVSLPDWEQQYTTAASTGGRLPVRAVQTVDLRALNDRAVAILGQDAAQRLDEHGMTLMDGALFQQMEGDRVQYNSLCAPIECSPLIRLCRQRRAS